jgi:hypothetical protein
MRPFVRHAYMAGILHNTCLFSAAIFSQGKRKFGNTVLILIPSAVPQFVLPSLRLRTEHPPTGGQCERHRTAGGASAEVLICIPPCLPLSLLSSHWRQRGRRQRSFGRAMFGRELGAASSRIGARGRRAPEVCSVGSLVRSCLPEAKLLQP